MPDLRRPDGRSMHHSDLYSALGLDPSKHLPPEGVPARLIDNVWVWVVPKGPFPQDAARTWCKCPHCDKVLTAGKLHQHLKVHKDRQVSQVSQVPERLIWC